MIHTVVLIGEFFGELNWLKEAVCRLGTDYRCVSFTDRDAALKLLLRDHILHPDFIIVDDTMPVSALSLLKTVERADRDRDAVLAVFSRRQLQEPKIHPALKVKEFYKSPDKKSYTHTLQMLTSTVITQNADR